MKEQTEQVEQQDKKPTKILVWENIQLGCLALTIFGQVAIGASFLLGQGVWFIANVIALIRDFILGRPMADKVKNAALTALTAGIIAAYLMGWYQL